jgi:hypothetical protein
MEKKIFLPEFRSALLMVLYLDFVAWEVSVSRSSVKRSKI